MPMFFQSGDSDGVLFDVPVLDGALDYSATFCPDARRLTLPPGRSALEAVAESPHRHEHGRLARVLLDA